MCIRDSLYIALLMPAQAIHYFMLSPYSVVMDVKMLDFFRHMGTATLISVTVLLIASLFIRHAWCRYLCPYGALMGVVSLLSPFKIRRNAESCIDCGKCAKNCPSRIPVDKDVSKRPVQGEYVELSDGTLSWLGNALFWMPLPEPPQEVNRG